MTMSEENMMTGQTGEINSLEEKLRQAVDEIDHIKNSFTESTQNLARIKSMLDVGAIQEISSTIEKYEGQLSEIEQQREEAFQGAKKYSEELEKEKERLIKLWDAYKKQEEELSKAEGKLQEFENRAKKAEEEKHRLETDYTDRINTLTQKVEENNEQMKKLDEYETRINEFNSIRNDLQDKNQTLKQEVQQQKETTQKLQQQLDKAKEFEKYADYKDRFQEINQQYDKEKERLTKLYHLYEETESECNRLKKQNAQWQSWFDSNKQIFDKLFSNKPPANSFDQPKKQQNSKPNMTTSQPNKQTQTSNMDNTADNDKKKRGFFKK